MFEPFSPEVITTHRMFYLLRDTPADCTQLGIYTQTPSGLTPVDFVDVYEVGGRLMLAWKEPFKHQVLHNLVVTHAGGREIANLIPVERMWEFYDRPLDSDSGAFSFVSSQPGDPGIDEWRCDRHGYTGRVFGFTQPLFARAESIQAVEYALSVNGLGHVMYVQAVMSSEYEDQVNAAEAPLSARTFQEMMKLLDEWSQATEPPFSNRQACAVAASQFLDEMNLTSEELAEVRSQTPMQVVQYLSGSTDARRRPTNVKPLSQTMKRLLFKRMASSSASVVLSLGGDHVRDFPGLVDMEMAELNNGISRFRQYYGIPESVELTDIELLLASVAGHRESPGLFVANQARQFSNKLGILEAVKNGEI
jgi:hypothetical protein